MKIIKIMNFLLFFNSKLKKLKIFKNVKFAKIHEILNIYDFMKMY